MKKIFGTMTIVAAVLFTTVRTYDMQKNSEISGITLVNVEALAQNEKNCPGGSCTFKDSFGNECTTCCPEGKDPKCNTFGCSCE